jgi:hypothetical protein
MTAVTLATLTLLAGACWSTTSSPTPRDSPRDLVVAGAAVDAAPAIAHADARQIAPVTLAADDCTVLHDAPALGVAVVILSKPDCSSVGHRRIALEVRRLVRGTAIQYLVTSRPLYERGDKELEVGDVVVVAIEPVQRPAETVYCVALPAHEGTVKRAVEVDSEATANRIADEIAAGTTCAGR